MKIAIIIINWNRSDETLCCLRSINFWNKGSRRIYVVDNGSHSGEVEKLTRTDLEFTLIKLSDNQGFSGGNNAGIKAALADNHDAIWLLNNDADIHKKDACRIERILETENDIGVVGPLLYDKNTWQLLNAGGRDIGWNYISHYREVQVASNLYEVDYISGTVVLIRSELFRIVGLLDEKYFFSGEIADFCKRVQLQQKHNKSKYRIVIEPEAKAYHDMSIASSARENVHTYYIVRNRFIYIRKYLMMYVPILYIYWIYKYFMHLSSCIYHRKYLTARYIIRGVFDGLAGTNGKI